MPVADSLITWQIVVLVLVVGALSVLPAALLVWSAQRSVSALEAALQLADAERAELRRMVLVLAETEHSKPAAPALAMQLQRESTNGSPELAAPTSRVHPGRYLRRSQ